MLNECLGWGWGGSVLCGLECRHAARAGPRGPGDPAASVRGAAYILLKYTAVTIVRIATIVML